jgi:hypothetical protein
MLNASTIVTVCDCPPPPPSLSFIIYYVHDVKLWLRTLIHLLFFSQDTPLHFSAEYGHLHTCRLLLLCNARLEAKNSKCLPPN